MEPANLNLQQTRNYTFVLVIFFLLNVMTTAAAQTQPESDPQQIIENASIKIKTRLGDPVFSKDFDRVVDFVESVIDPHIDFNLVSTLVLGKFWKTATPPQRASFKKEFKTLLLRTYSRVFVELDDWTIEFLPGISRSNERKVLIKTRVKQSGLQPVDVDYRMFDINGDWKVYDISIDGVSLVNTYRSTFKNDIDASGSIAPLIKKLAEKNAERSSSPKD